MFIVCLHDNENIYFVYNKVSVGLSVYYANLIDSHVLTGFYVYSIFSYVWVHSSILDQKNIVTASFVHYPIG